MKWKGKIVDIMLAHHLLFPDLEHSLAFIGSCFTSKPSWKDNKESLQIYNIRDCDVTLQAYQQLMPMLKKENLESLYWDVQIPLAKICLLLHQTGFKVDGNRIKFVREKLLKELTYEETNLPEFLKGYNSPIRKRNPAPEGTLGKSGKPIKFILIDSTERVTPWRSGVAKQRYLYSTEKDCLGLEPILDPKTGNITTGKIALDKIFSRTKNPAVRALRRLNQLDETITTFAKEEMVKTSRVYPHYNVHGTASGRLSSSDPNCFDAHTEILTSRGWRLVPEVTSQDNVAQWEQGEISFVHPTHLYQETATELIQLENQHIDLRLTPDHRCLLQHRKTGQYKTVLARDYPGDYLQLHAGTYSGPGYDLTDAELILLCAIQADGSYDGRQIDFVFNKQRKVTRLLAALKQLGDSAYFSLKSKGIKSTRIKVSGVVVEKIKRILGPSKTMGDWIIQLNQSQLSRLTEEVMHWDGCVTRMNHYSSSIKQNADWIQIAYILCNRRANVREYLPPSGRVNYQVDVIARNYSHTTNISKAHSQASELVYCLSVPSGFVVVRRNGKVCITGQCQNIPESARHIYVPSHPGWKIVDVDYSQIENRLTAWFAGDKERAARFIADPKFSEHKYAASLFLNIPYDQVEKDNSKDAPYGKAKRIVHGSNYGMGHKKIANLYDMELGETRRLQDLWKSAIKPTITWQGRCGQEAKDKGVLTTPFGRKRWFWTSSYYTEALSFLPQSTAADVIFRAMIGLMYERIGLLKSQAERVCRYSEALSKPANLLIQVHDSLIFECPEPQVDSLVAIVTRVMCQSWKELGGMSIPIGVKVGDSWGDCE